MTTHKEIPFKDLAIGDMAFDENEGKIGVITAIRETYFNNWYFMIDYGGESNWYSECAFNEVVFWIDPEESNND